MGEFLEDEADDLNSTRTVLTCGDAVTTRRNVLPPGHRVRLRTQLSDVPAGSLGSVVSSWDGSSIQIRWDEKKKKRKSRVSDPLGQLDFGESLQRAGLGGKWRYTTVSGDSSGVFEIIENAGLVYREENETVTLQYDGSSWYEAEIGTCTIRLRRDSKEMHQVAERLELLVVDSTGREIEASARRDLSMMLGIWDYGDNFYVVERVHGSLWFSEIHPDGTLLCGEIRYMKENKWITTLRTANGTSRGNVRLEVAPNDCMRSEFQKPRDGARFEEPVLSKRIEDFGPQSILGVWKYTLSEYSIELKPKTGAPRFVEVHPDGETASGFLSREGQWWTTELVSNARRIGFVRLRIEDDEVYSQFRASTMEKWDEGVTAQRTSSKQSSTSRSVKSARSPRSTKASAKSPRPGIVEISGKRSTPPVPCLSENSFRSYEKPAPSFRQAASPRSSPRSTPQRIPRSYEKSATIYPSSPRSHSYTRTNYTPPSSSSTQIPLSASASPYSSTSSISSVRTTNTARSHILYNYSPRSEKSAISNSKETPHVKTLSPRFYRSSLNSPRSMERHFREKAAAKDKPMLEQPRSSERPASFSRSYEKPAFRPSMISSPRSMLASY